MKKLVQLFAILIIGNVNAQIGGGWDWAFNTGSLGGANIKHMKYTSDGSEILFGGNALAAAYFGTTTLSAPPLGSFPGQIKFFGKINSATGIPTIIKSFSNLPINFDCITTDDGGNFYIGGAISSVNSVDLGNGVSVSGMNKCVIAKFNASGSAIWAKTYALGVTGAVQTNILKLAVSNAGNLFFWAYNGNADANSNRNSPLYKLDSSGNTLWFKDALNSSNTISYQVNEPSLSDKFIDNNENVHLFLNATGGYTFDGVAYPNGSASLASTLISLNAAGTITKAQSFAGGISSFQVLRNSGNLVFKWTQSNANVAPFNNLPRVLASLSPTYANHFKGMVETTSNFSFIKAKDYSTVIDNPFQINYNNDVFLALPNGKLIIQTEFVKTVSFIAGVDYGYLDDSNTATAIVETDTNWNIAKFITGGKTASVFKQYLTSYNDTYAMSAGFSSHDILISPSPTLPTTSYGTVNLIGFNAASDLTTAYGIYSTTSGFRKDYAIVQTKSQNFPLIASTTWLGTTNNWNMATNWSNGVPTAGMKAFFNAATTNFPMVSSSPTAATLEVSAGVNITLPTTLALVGNLKNDGNIILNNVGQFNGLGAKEWKGTGSVTFSGTGATFMYNNSFTNSLVLNSNVSSFRDLTIPMLTLNNAGLTLFGKKLSITNPSPSAISGANNTSYINGGTVERAINAIGIYEFPMGTVSFAQTAIINANNLVGINRIATTFTEGAITGSTPNTTISGVAITSALNGGWFSINPNQQPTSGNYDVTLKIQGSTNLSPTVGNYVVINRNNATSPWATAGNYNVATTAGGVVTIKNSNLTSFSDFAIGRAASDVSLSNDDFTANKFSIFPNPTASLVTISAKETISKIDLFDIAGKQILSQNANGATTNLDLSNLNSGIYFARILMINGIISTQKIVKN